MRDDTIVQDLSESQRERRQGIIDAATALAQKGGYDAVQMRDVADHADVALGTLYRYFPSKTHLLIAVLYQQTNALARRARRRELDGDTPAQRVNALLGQATRALQREPELTEAMLRGLMSADSSAAPESDAVSSLVTDLIIRAIQGNGEEPHEDDGAIARVIEQVWMSSLLAWLGGRSSTKQMNEDLETATRLLLDGR